VKAATALFALALTFLVPKAGLAQEAAPVASTQLPPNAACARSILTELSADSPAALTRFLNGFCARVQPLAQRFQDEGPLRQVGVLVGLSSAALGVLHGRPALTVIGTRALNIGLDKPLSEIRRRSGFSLEPSLGLRAVAITANRRW
jgi:hypothetical protein